MVILGEVVAIRLSPNTLSQHTGIMASKVSANTSHVSLHASNTTPDGPFCLSAKALCLQARSAWHKHELIYDHNSDPNRGSYASGISRFLSKHFRVKEKPFSLDFSGQRFTDSRAESQQASSLPDSGGDLRGSGGDDR